VEFADLEAVASFFRNVLLLYSFMCNSTTFFKGILELNLLVKLVVEVSRGELLAILLGIGLIAGRLLCLAWYFNDCLDSALIESAECTGTDALLLAQMDVVSELLVPFSKIRWKSILLPEHRVLLITVEDWSAEVRKSHLEPRQ